MLATPYGGRGLTPGFYAEEGVQEELKAMEDGRRGVGQEKNGGG